MSTSDQEASLVFLELEAVSGEIDAVATFDAM